VPDDDIPLIDAFLLPDDVGDTNAEAPGELVATASDVAGLPGWVRLGDEAPSDESDEMNAVSSDRGDTNVRSYDVKSEPDPPAQQSPSAVEWPDDMWGADGAEPGDHPADDVEGGSPSLLAGRFDEDAAVVGTIGQGRNRAEPLADALVTVAERIRSGELVVSGYDEGMGQAAALAATLAALLGVRS
jgi:hypothetical protein